MRKLTLLVVAAAVLVAAGGTPLVFGQGSKPADAAAVTTITKFYDDGAKVDLTNDPKTTVPFYEKWLADDYTGGSSRGTWDTRQSSIADLKDPKNNKTNSSSLSDLKVRVSADVAVATYKSTYDSLIRGEHYSRSVICTDVFQRRDGGWKEIVSHCSQAAK
jgi:hypothetical protein